MNPAMWRGSAHHGREHAAQSGAMRPVPGWAQYRMPFPPLSKPEPARHPAARLPDCPAKCGNGYAQDFGTSIEEVVRKTEQGIVKNSLPHVSGDPGGVLSRNRVSLALTLPSVSWRHIRPGVQCFTRTADGKARHEADSARNLAEHLAARQPIPYNHKTIYVGSGM